MPSSHDDDRAARLAALEREHAELEASLPKHSVPPAMIIRLEELEDAIAALRAAIAQERQRPDTDDAH